jgi:hypothetical protein
MTDIPFFGNATGGGLIPPQMEHNVIGEALPIMVDGADEERQVDYILSKLDQKRDILKQTTEK